MLLPSKMSVALADAVESVGSLFAGLPAGNPSRCRMSANCRWRSRFSASSVRRRSSAVGGGAATGRSAWALDASKSGVFLGDDSLSLRFAQPLRVERGALLLSLPVAYSYATSSATQGLRTLALTPHGRELEAELAWRAALGSGTLSTSLFYRHDPGHYANGPADAGAAVSWNTRF